MWRWFKNLDPGYQYLIGALIIVAILVLLVWWSA